MRSAFILLFVSLFIFSKSFSQINSADTTKPLKIAVLVPVYIDSAFSNFAYKLGENKIPQYILSGLDFYNGVMLAIDALQKEGADIEVNIYDTKKARQDINEILKTMKPLKFSLIIASLTSAAEQKAVSEFSFDNSIPVISSTYPNDANLSENPFFVMLNPTLKTHVDGIHKLLKKSYATAKPIYIRKSGATEDKIESYFKASDTLKNAVKYRVKELDENFTESSLLSLLDSSRQNVIICGTLNEAFGVKLVQTISASQSYYATVIGMPTWDAIRQFNTLDCQGVELMYSTPYNFSKTDKASANLISNYKAKFFARPSDMVFKGHESMYHFTHLLIKYREFFIIHLSDALYKLYSDFSIQTVKTNPQSFLFDYQENKTLYFIKKLNGNITAISPLQ